MPDLPRDWRRQVRDKLADSKLSRDEREDVAQELAGYLDDLCDGAAATGSDDCAAARIAASELHEDKRLGATLYRARKENRMNLNDRTKRFWLPGIITLLASATCLAILQVAGLRADFVPLWLRGGAATANSFYLPLAIHWPWLCVLPFIGAVGALWSRRAGGSRAVQSAAGFFSVLAVLATLFVVLVLSFIQGGILGGIPTTMTLFPEVIGAILSWVVIPGIALLAGIAPFLRSGSSPSNARQVVERATHHAWIAPRLAERSSATARGLKTLRR